MRSAISFLCGKNEAECAAMMPAEYGGLGERTKLEPISKSALRIWCGYDPASARRVITRHVRATTMTDAASRLPRTSLPPLSLARWRVSLLVVRGWIFNSAYLGSLHATRRRQPRQHHRQDAGEEDAVEGARATDGSDRRAESAYEVKIIPGQTRGCLILHSARRAAGVWPKARWSINIAHYVEMMTGVGAPGRRTGRQFGRRGALLARRVQ